MPLRPRGRRAPKEDRGTMWSTIGAGILGGVEGYWTGREQQRKEKQTEQSGELAGERNEISRLNLELRQLIAEINEGGRMTRHQTPSGSVTAQQEGATARNQATIASREKVATAGQDVQRFLEEGRNTRFGDRLNYDYWNTETRDATTRRGQDVSSATTMRGQDIGAGTAQRGQDIGAETARRGQDVRDAAAEADRNMRFTIENEKWRRNRSIFDEDGPDEAPPVPVLPRQQSMNVPDAPPTVPVVPRSPEAPADQEAQDTQRLQAAMLRVTTATNPQDREAARKELERLATEIRARRQARP